jgi:hypothetical protein
VIYAEGAQVESFMEELQGKNISPIWSDMTDFTSAAPHDAAGAQMWRAWRGRLCPMADLRDPLRVACDQLLPSALLP